MEDNMKWTHYHKESCDIAKHRKAIYARINKPDDEKKKENKKQRYKQPYVRIGFMCLACHRMDYDPEWLKANQEEFKQEREDDLALQEYIKDMNELREQDIDIFYEVYDEPYREIVSHEDSWKHRRWKNAKNNNKRHYQYLRDPYRVITEIGKEDLALKQEDLRRRLIEHHLLMERNTDSK